MVDYYPLLNRAIASLGQPDAAARASIYERARAALERQLRNFDPPVPEDEIRTQLETLENVITRIESELTSPPAPVGGGQIETRAEAPTPPPLALTPDATADPVPVAPEDADIPAEPALRPRIPVRNTTPTANRKPLYIFLAIGIVAISGMGLLAMTRMGKTSRSEGPPVVTAPGETGVDPAKTEGRLAGAENQPTSQVAPPASAPSTPRTPPATAAQTPPAGQPGPAGTVVTQGATGRAFMVLEPAPGAPGQFEGRVNWSYLPDSSLGGQKSLRALIEFPTAQFNVDFSISRNSDGGLGTSHIIMVIFDGRNGLGNVLEMSAVEWRERENQVGGLLNGMVVPIQTNVFMIGLDKAEANIARNLALLQSQKWMVFEFRLQNGRRGAVLVEKALSGEQSITEALRDWRR